MSMIFRAVPNMSIRQSMKMDMCLMYLGSGLRPNTDQCPRTLDVGAWDMSTAELQVNWSGADIIGHLKSAQYARQKMILRHGTALNAKRKLSTQMKNWLVSLKP